ncbi:hypothetical protein AvCA_01360 [Azotobacter vinelandii CA]|uniref:Uncharacterized protein n=2 Tax=Azotobacter vinelandii TaxID=354 RepID=C1DGZ4_AZOVD|nr:hypothetical protein [Azotobacter vinelandii]ACO76401.1 conserved hypothetical protein [Azotobacter vinelandii DJ]AGK17413.1 hypothetical protein AvCA_01360 [Azotobacter vinelandii CA]AGK19105.1 hypothetical protein AvCA6_01360 [Azotobacter vinelandii CA6]WKN22180.1 hypothetical protein AVAEIV_000130 [Azotobacter vinelandii]SFX76625.1 hypothetical protein SAMN04244547_02688 [Azotobacter vinelandii]
MLLKSYEDQSLLCNLSVKGPTTQAGIEAFRGDLVIVEGDIADDAGRRLPPKAVLKQAALLFKNDKLIMVSGGLVQLADLQAFFEKYKGDLASDANLIFYVENLTKPLISEYEGFKVTLQAHEEGAVWNVMMEDLRLDKEDFKGQSPEDKVITMAEGLADFKPKYDTVSFADAQTFTADIKREHRGPV